MSAVHRESLKDEPGHPPVHTAFVHRSVLAVVSLILQTCFLAVLITTIPPSPARAASDPIQTAGDILQIAMPVAAYGSTIYRFDHPESLQWDETGSIEYTESLGTTLGVTYALKYSVTERRPNGGSQSFPSGHTSAAMSAAEFLRRRYGWEYGLPAYALAGFVGYSRVESQEHYPHDVLAGAAIGFISSFVFTRPYHGFRVQPMRGPAGEQGIKFIREW